LKDIVVLLGPKFVPFPTRLRQLSWLRISWPVFKFLLVR